MYSRIKNIGVKIVRKIPHYKFNRKIKLTELLGDLCLIRSELNLEILDYSNRVEKLSIIYNSVAHYRPIQQESINNLIKFQNKANATSKRVNSLLSMNSSTTNSILKLNKSDYIKNPDVEKGIYISIKKAERINKTFEELSKKIANLNSLEKP